MLRISFTSNNKTSAKMMNSKYFLIIGLLVSALSVATSDKGSNETKALYCFSCNANADECAVPVDRDKLKGHLVPCNGQCVKFKNPNDNDSEHNYLKIFFDGKISKLDAVCRSVSWLFVGLWTHVEAVKCL